MQLRDKIPQSFHHTILRLSSYSTIQECPGFMIPGKSRSWYCRTLRLSSHSCSVFHNFSCITWSQFACQVKSSQQCQCIHSCTHMVNYSGRTLASQQLGKKGPQHDFASRSTAATTHCEVLAADPTGLVATVRGDHSKKKTLTHFSMIREKKNMAGSAPTATLSETKNHSSIPHQNNMKDQKHHRSSTPHSIPLAILEMLLLNNAELKTWKKASTREYLSTKKIESLAFPLTVSCSHRGQGDKQRMEDRQMSPTQQRPSTDTCIPPTFFHKSGMAS